MEPNMPNPADDPEKLRRLQEIANQSSEEGGLSRKRKIQIVILAGGGILLAVLFFLFPSDHKTDKKGKAVLAANRGLMQAEDIRRQKELFEQKKKNTDEEDWIKRIQALRSASGKTDSMPNPTSLFPESGKGSSQSGGSGTETNLPSAEETHSDSLGGNFQVTRDPPHGKGLVPKFKSSVDMVEGGNSRDASGEAPGFKPDVKMTERMSDEYQKALAYNASEQLVFTKDRGEEQKPAGAMKTAAPNASAGGTKVSISAGQELRAVLTESISSDYPSVAKATMTSPAELSGATLLLSYSLGEERVTAQVVKLILPKKDGERAKEMTLSAVVKSGLPGLSGDVSHHWIPQIASGLANAGLTAGALAYASQNQSKDLGTAVLVAPMIEQSVQGVLKPINYLGRDRPVTVTVPAGTEFTLLVTDGFEVEL